MKKKLLFFGYTLEMGGAEKVMVDFLKALQPHYDITIALLQAKGVLLQELPKDIRVVQMRNGFFSYLLFRYIPFFRKRKINQIANAENYHAAVGFLEGRSATWVADIKKDIRRIAWIHTDVAHFDIGIPDAEAAASYAKMDAVVLVSQDAKRSFVSKFPFAADRATVLYNLIDETAILQKAQASVKSNDCFTFINVGRMIPPKRQERLVEAARYLKDAGFRFKIQIIGSGSEEENIRQLILQKDVSDVVELLGLQTNPYPYVKQADCFVLTSDFEGFGIVVKEALLLGTPVISTAVTGVKELLSGGQYGILCPINTHDICQAMGTVLSQLDILEDFRKNLQHYDCANNAITDKLFSLIEGDLTC